MAKARDGRLRPTGRQAGAMTEMDHGEMRNQLPLLSYFRRLGLGIEKNVGKTGIRPNPKGAGKV